VQVPPPKATELVFSGNALPDSSCYRAGGIVDGALCSLEFQPALDLHIQLPDQQLLQVRVWAKEPVDEMLARVLPPVQHALLERSWVCREDSQAAEKQRLDMRQTVGEANITSGMLLSCKQVFCEEEHTVQGHYWSPDAYTLPLKFRYDVRADTGTAECIGAFSHTKAAFGAMWDNVDALSWYLAPHRNDFTFRTRMFGEFPSVEHIRNTSLLVGAWATVEVELAADSATYSVDGNMVARANLAPGEICAQSGHIGFVTWDNKPFTVRNLVIHE